MRIEIDYLMDDTVCRDVIEVTTVNAKIKKDRTGYVKTPGESRIYARIERIVITGGQEMPPNSGVQWPDDRTGCASC